MIELADKPATAQATADRFVLDLDEKRVTQPLVAQEQHAITTRGAAPGDLLRIAIERGDGDLDRMERLMRMERDWRLDEDSRQFSERMAILKKNPPDIIKRKEVAFNDTRYKHAEHSDVTLPIIEWLGTQGITHRWRPAQRDGQMGIACILKFGLYEECTELFAPPDTSAKKNPIQSLMSTKTYLERHTLIAATGLTTRELEDDDGRGGDGNEQSPVGKVFDSLCEQAEATKTDGDAHRVWSIGNKLLHALGATDAANDFKDRVARHRRAIAGTQ